LKDLRRRLVGVCWGSKSPSNEPRGRCNAIIVFVSDDLEQLCRAIAALSGDNPSSAMCPRMAFDSIVRWQKDGRGAGDSCLLSAGHARHNCRSHDAGHVARKMSSRSQLSHRTYGGSPNWLLDHHQPVPCVLHNCCGRQYHRVLAAQLLQQNLP
jgi:hypothetical protein